MSDTTLLLFCSNLVFIVGAAMRLESRITRIEAELDYIRKQLDNR